MKGAALGVWASLLLLLQGPAGGHQPSRKVTSQELRSLQDLLGRLEEQTPGEGGEPLGLEHPDYGAGEDDPAWEAAEPEIGQSAGPRDPGSPTEAESQWRSLLASPRRMRHFSGCFGTRLGRIGSQSGLGCNLYRSRSWKRRSRG